MLVPSVDTSCSCQNEVCLMIRSPATLTIANFNRQTLADLLRPVLDRAMTQGMVGTNVVLEIVAEALSLSLIHI